jgi:DNA repair exonuclease SbcCD ATPase subunit
MMASPKLKLKRIEVEGFRGVNRPLSLDFDEAATFLVCPNGQGKSSILGAIEWCLFGELKYQARENATNDELINLHSVKGQARVRLILQKGAEEFVVERERRIGRRETKLRVWFRGGEVSVEADPVAVLFRLIGLSFDDFYRAVYLHQESIRGLLTDEPRVRDEAFDRLFGVEKLRDILAAIQMRLITDAVKEIEGKRTRATDRLSGAVEQIEEQRKRYLKEAMDAAFTEAELTLGTGIALANQIMISLADTCRATNLPAPDLVDVMGVDDFEKAARKAKEIIRNIRISGPRSSGLDTATDQIFKLSLIRKHLASAELDAREASSVLGGQQSRVGDAEALGRRRSELSTLIGQRQQQLELLDVRIRVVSDAVLYLKEVSAATVCPVCDQRINAITLIRRLETETQESQAAESQQLNREIGETKQELEVALEAERELKRLQKQAGVAADRLTAVLKEASSMTGPMPHGAEVAARLEAAETALVRQVASLKEAQGQWEDRLGNIDSSVDRLRVLQRFLKTDSDFVALRDKAPNHDEGETDAIQDELNALLSLQESLEVIARSINSVAKARAMEALSLARVGISSYYKSLCNHPYFDGIRIDVEDKSLRGIQKNSYSVQTFCTPDGKKTLASSRLSAAQMNCVALSVYLALAGTLNHNLGFVILDDPSQSLDDGHKAALAQILVGMVPGTQLVIATQDRELHRLLAKEFAPNLASTYGLSWTARNGTEITAVR